MEKFRPSEDSARQMHLANAVWDDAHIPGVRADTGNKNIARPQLRLWVRFVEGARNPRNIVEHKSAGANVLGTHKGYAFIRRTEERAR
jgi:hypothetical protein